MQVEILKAALETVISVTKPNKTIEGHVLIKMKDGTLTVASESADHSVVTMTKADAPNFSFVIPRDLANHLLKNLRGKEVTFRMEGEFVIVQLGRSKFEMALRPDAEVTVNRLLSNYKDKFHTTVDGETFNLALNKVKHNVNDSEIGDIVLKGFHLTLDGKKVELMSTNAVAMAVTSFDSVTEYPGEEPLTVVLNGEFINLSRIFLSRTHLYVDTDNKTLSVETTDGVTTTRVVSGLVSGAPRKYRPIFGKVAIDNVIKFQVDRKEFLSLLKSNEMFTDKEQRFRLYMTIEDNVIRVETKNAKGKAQNEIVAEKTTNTLKEPLTIVIKSDIIIKAVANSASEYITLSFNNAPNSPIMTDDDMTANVLVVFKQ